MIRTPNLLNRAVKRETSKEIEVRDGFNVEITTSSVGALTDRTERIVKKSMYARQIENMTLQLEKLQALHDACVDDEVEESESEESEPIEE